VFVATGTETDEFGDAGVEPTEGIRKFQRLQGMDFIAVAEGDEAGLREGALVQREDEGAIEAGSVIGAGSVAEVVLEMRKARPPAEKISKLIINGRGLGAPGRFGSLGRFRMAGKTFGNGNRPAIRKLEMIFGEAAFEGEARNVERIPETIEFFLFNGKEDGGFVQQSYRRAAADGGNAEKDHGSVLR